MNEKTNEQPAPAGDGGQHVEVLRQMIPQFKGWREGRAALDAAIAALTAAGQGGEGEPDTALLVSMATCLNHGFGLLPEDRQRSMLADMRKLWDEVMGRGYYTPANRERYTAMLAAAPQQPAAMTCPECRSPGLLFECVGCSATNFPSAAPSVSEHDAFFGPVDTRAVIFPPKPVHPTPEQPNKLARFANAGGKI